MNVAALTIICVSGGVSKPSRTTTVVEAVLSEIQRKVAAQVGLIELAEAHRHIFAGLSRADIPPTGEAILRRIEDADVIVVGTPVYRGSYTGAFKHLFDLVDHRVLAGKSVVLTATGGSAMHGLMLEHQLRPLFGFFGSFMAPTTVYGVPEDFKDGRIVSDLLLERVARAAGEAVTLAPAAPSEQSRHFSLNQR